ncbi:FecR family protein [Niabella soli]|uniref:Anti-FecI sigma factor FecR n=1 Tax=Niabella soli DSM 19437 TaxID=929713 RepID=W0F485_9BACT|nr:FecR domain-containing protein [Niabella soli]AHF17875.1 hypothetical protein NIASO_15940 [Niabella soli DSM 19437]
MRDDAYIWKLMARSIYGEASPAEQQELRKYFIQYPDLKQQFELLYPLLGKKQLPEEKMEEPDYARKATELVEKARGLESAPVIQLKRRRRAYYAAAGIVIAVIGAAAFLLYKPATVAIKKDPVALALATGKGARKQMLLPDGSQVWLNGGSNLYYVTDFKGATREVRLEGEAFFDVVKDRKHPFIVHAGTIDVKVLGTAFNVKAYSSEANITTVLYRGLVSITRHEGNKNFQPVLLYPNQKIVIPSKEVVEDNATANEQQQDAIKIETIDSTKKEQERVETAWMYNRLEFRGDDFATLANKMEQWYNVEIRFADDRVKQLNFNGSFEKETVQQALAALKIANPFNYIIENNVIVISSLH